MNNKQLILLKGFCFAHSRLLPASSAALLLKLLFTVRKRVYPNDKLGLPDSVYHLPDETSLIHWKGSNGKSVLLVHGWDGSGNQYENIFNSFKLLGYAIYVLHPKGYGLSKAPHSNPAWFIKAVQAARKFIGVPFSVAVGHSMGAGALALSASSEKIAEKLILVSTPDSFYTIVTDFANHFSVGDRAKKQFTDLVKEQVGIEYERLMVKKQMQLITQPILIIHDENDRILPIQHALNLNEHANNADLFITKSYGHNRLLGSQAVLRKINEFCLLSEKEVQLSENEI